MSKSYFTSPHIINKVILANNGTLEFESSNYKTILQGNENINADLTLTLPIDAGTDGQVLKTNGSGALSWVNNGSGGAGGQNGQIQYNDSGTLSGLWDFIYINNNFMIGEDSGDTKLQFRSIGTYINSGTLNELTVHSNSVLYLSARDELTDTGTIQLSSLHNINLYPDGDLNLEAAQNVYCSSNNIMEHEAFSTSNGALKLTAASGGIEITTKRLTHNIERLTIGFGGSISSNSSVSASIWNPNATVLYISPEPNEGANTFYWDLQSYGEEGQYLTIFYDNTTTTNAVSLNINFRENGLVSGSGNASALLFETHGQSAHLICIPNYYNYRQWYIINTGAAVIANPT